VQDKFSCAKQLNEVMSVASLIEANAADGRNRKKIKNLIDDI